MISTENSVIVNHYFYFKVDKYVGPISAAGKVFNFEIIIIDLNFSKVFVISKHNLLI